jgi:hypothetical protein
MHGTILRMIATNSLSAFTSAAPQAASLGGVGGVQPVRSRAPDAPPKPTPPSGGLGLAPPGSATPPPSNLPRGSLLDLSV